MIATFVESKVLRPVTESTEASVITLSPSTAILPADTREIVVSVACQSSMAEICGLVALTKLPVPVPVYSADVR